MTKEETIISNVMRIIKSKEASELQDFDIYDSLIEEDEIFVGGKSFFPECVIETVSTPLILMMDIIGPHRERRIRIIVMCEGEIKMNIMSADNNNTRSVIKIFKDEEDWEQDIEMLAWYLTEQKPKEEAIEADDEDLLF